MLQVPFGVESRRDRVLEAGYKPFGISAFDDVGAGERCFVVIQHDEVAPAARIERLRGRRACLLVPILPMPTTCPGVPDSVLDPRSTWPDATAYDQQARKLAAMFVENFKAFEKDVDPAVRAAGPTA